MIDVRELRIGNLIYEYRMDMETKERENVKISVMPNTLTQILQETNVFNPIPLTEEWLLKMGFKKVNDGYEFDKSSCHFENEFCWVYILGKSFEIELILSKEYRVNLRVQYNFVHQIQNVIYSVFGKELKIK